jgi:hypothetical protein
LSPTSAERVEPKAAEMSAIRRMDFILGAC